MKMAVFWVVAQCNLVQIDRRFRGACCIHHQGDTPEYNTPEVIFICLVGLGDEIWKRPGITSPFCAHLEACSINNA
jgi:hypothetical protein